MGLEIPATQVSQRISILVDLNKFVWMQRMWETLENFHLGYCSRSDQNGHGTSARDTFAQLVNGGHAQLIGIFRWTKTFTLSPNLVVWREGKICKTVGSVREK